METNFRGLLIHTVVANVVLVPYVCESLLFNNLRLWPSEETAGHHHQCTRCTSASSLHHDHQTTGRWILPMFILDSTRNYLCNKLSPPDGSCWPQAQEFLLSLLLGALCETAWNQCCAAINTNGLINCVNGRHSVYWCDQTASLTFNPVH